MGFQHHLSWVFFLSSVSQGKRCLIKDSMMSLVKLYMKINISETIAILGFAYKTMSLFENNLITWSSCVHYDHMIIMCLLLSHDNHVSSILTLPSSIFSSVILFISWTDGFSCININWYLDFTLCRWPSCTEISAICIVGIFSKLVCSNL